VEPMGAQSESWNQRLLSHVAAINGLVLTFLNWKLRMSFA
jgi:hypothetical protein